MLAGFIWWWPPAPSRRSDTSGELASSWAGMTARTAPLPRSSNFRRALTTFRPWHPLHLGSFWLRCVRLPDQELAPNVALIHLFPPRSEDPLRAGNRSPRRTQRTQREKVSCPSPSRNLCALCVLGGAQGHLKGCGCVRAWRQRQPREEPPRSASCPPLLEVLRQVPDPRFRRGVRHPLAALLTLACAAMLCGYGSYRAIAEWGCNYDPAFLRALGLTRQTAPCAATFFQIFRRLDRERCAGLPAGAGGGATAGAPQPDRMRTLTATASKGRRQVMRFFLPGIGAKGATQGHHTGRGGTP